MHFIKEKGSWNERSPGPSKSEVKVVHAPLLHINLELTKYYVDNLLYVLFCIDHDNLYNCIDLDLH